MGLIKKNLVFSIIVLGCSLAFAAGAYFTFAESAAVNDAEEKVSSTRMKLENVLNANPAPTEANIEAARQNVARLTAKLETIRTDLEQGARLTTSTDGIGVMAAVQRFISEYDRRAEEHVDDNEEADPIEVPDNFAFGFERYFDEAEVPEDAAAIPVLDKQRQILSYLLNKLFNADPQSIVSVKREVLETKASGDGGNQKPRGDQGFGVDPAISARVPGAIDTLGFSLTFTGYTDTLREFLNSLAKFDLPIVVRSIEVTRPDGQTTVAAPAASGNNLDAIFGVFEGDSSAEETAAAPREAQKPVISENVSTFTVILEFIEIVLPKASQGE